MLGAIPSGVPPTQADKLLYTSAPAEKQPQTEVPNAVTQVDSVSAAPAASTFEQQSVVTDASFAPVPEGGLFQKLAKPQNSNPELTKALGGFLAALKATMPEVPPGMGADQIVSQIGELTDRLVALTTGQIQTSDSPAAPAESAAETPATPAESAAETPATPAESTTETPAAPVEEESPPAVKGENPAGAEITQNPVLQNSTDLQSAWDNLLKLSQEKRLNDLLKRLDAAPTLEAAEELMRNLRREV